MKRLIPFFVVVASCSPQPPPGIAVPQPPPTASVAPVASSAPPPTASDTELAVGEAILLEGTPNGGPSNDTLDTWSPTKGKLVVIARKEGEATILFNDASGALTTRGFRVAKELCRDQPLHAVILTEPGGHAELTANADRAVDVLPRNVIGRAYPRDAGKLTVFGDNEGHGTVVAVSSAGEVQIWDLFVGGACAAKHYSSSVPSIPPGNLGPKGDGTCVRRDPKRPVIAAACPNPKTLESLPKEEFSLLTCEWARSCDRQGVEGCCVDCNNPFAMKIDRTCALKALRSKTCTDVQKTLDAKGCTH